MKKLSFLIAFVGILLTVGIFTSQAASYDAGSFSNLNFDFGRYVEDNVYKYKCDKNNYTCNKVKVSSLSTSTSSDLYDTESECKSKCKAPTTNKSYTEYTGGISTDLWASDDEENTNKDNWSYIDKTNNGLSGLDFSFGGGDKEESDFTKFSNPSNNLGFDLFSWGNENKKDSTVPDITNSYTDPFTSGLDLTAKDKKDSSDTKQTTNIFTGFLENLGFNTEAPNAFAPSSKPSDIFIPFSEDSIETTGEEGDKSNEGITFSVNPTKTYTKGQPIKITIENKPEIPENHEFYFWYDLKVDWKDTIDDDSDDLLKEANAINTDSFEIPTKDYYKIEITLKASTKGPYPKYEYKEYKSETVVLTLDKQEKKDIDEIINDCYLEITNLKPNTNKLTSENAKDVEVKFRLNCTDQNIDVKPLSVSAYIDVPGLYTIDKDIFKCEIKKFNGKDIYKKGTEYKLKCSEKTVKKALKKQGDNDTRTRYLMVDMYYKTNKKTGHNYGEEYTARFTSTRNKVIGTATGDGGGNQNDRNMEIEAIVNPGTERTFDTYEAGLVTIKWSSEGYEDCNISSGKLSWIAGEGLEGSKTFNILKNESKEPLHHTIKLKCSYTDGEETKTDEKSVQINVPECEKLEKICLDNKCDFNTGLGGQIILYQENGKITHSSDLAFSFKVTNGCNLNTFQKTFGRVSVDNKAINPDFTIWKGETERKAVFENVWSLLPEKTKENIEKTFEEYINADGVPVNFYTEVWSTFDEDLARLNEDGKKLNCNWTDKLPKKVIFVLDRSKKEYIPPGDTKPKNNDPDDKSKTGTIQKIFKLSVDKNNLKVNERRHYFLEGELPKDVKNVKCLMHSNWINWGEVDNLKRDSFESFKNLVTRSDGFEGWNNQDEILKHTPCEVWNQVRCEDENGNKYYSNSVKFIITEEEEPEDLEPSITIETKDNVRRFEASERYQIVITDCENIPDNAICTLSNSTGSNGFSRIKSEGIWGIKSSDKSDRINIECNWNENGENIIVKSNEIVIGLEYNEEYIYIQFECIGCDKCSKFVAIPTSIMQRSGVEKIENDAYSGVYDIKLPVNKTKHWTLKFTHCTTKGKINIKGNSSDWNIYNDWFSSDIGIYRKIKELSGGDWKNLGTVEIEITE